MKSISVAIILIGANLILAEKPRAATIAALSCSRADVGAAVTSARNGDTVLIPPGNCTWTTGIDSQCQNAITYPTLGFDASLCNPDGTVKFITIQGAGCALDGGGRPLSCQTVITDDVPKNAYSSNLIRWILNPNGLSRITGLAVRGTSGICQAVGSTNPNLYIAGDSNKLRIDHNRIETHDCPALMYDGYVRGVVDHNFYDLSGTPGVDSGGSGYGNYVFHRSWGNIGNYGDNSWAVPDTVGTAESLFFEDNVIFNNQSINWYKVGFDGWGGERIVVRRNNFRNTLFANHGADSGVRSCRQYEVYENTFTGSDGASPINLQGNAALPLTSSRGGVGLVFNNTMLISNGGIPTAAHSVVYYRSNYPAIFQGNDVYGYCTGSNKWDGNLDSSGWRCLDQTGAGYGQRLDTTPDIVNGVYMWDSTHPINTATGTQTWPNQVAQPTYVWGNTINGAPAGSLIAFASQMPMIVMGRDLIDGPRPGYTPFQYPHPLAAGGTVIVNAAPAKPLGLTLR